MRGHLFLVQADLRRLACDAWLLPTDAALDVQPHWGPSLQHAVEAFAAPAGWGDEVRASPLHHGEGPSIWLGCTGGVPTDDFDWYRRAVEQFLDGVAATGSTRALPLVALPAIGIGAGGQAGRKWAVLGPLVDYLRDEAGRRRLDIVLADVRSDVVAAAQARRRGDEEWPDLGEERVAHARRLGEAALARRLVLFVGAGVSQGAGLPGWRALLERLARAAEIEGPELEAFADRPLDWARVIESRLGAVDEETLGNHVAGLTTAERHALGHALLASLPVAEVATTNYDTLLELAADGIKRPFAVLPYQSAREGRWLLKLHGSVDHPSDIVITRQDYLRYADRRSALAGILQALLVTREMLFVGFSLDDDNFHRIADDVRKALAAHGRLGTAIALGRNPVIEAIWEREIDFVRMGDEHDAEAARRVDLFLDCLLHHATIGGAHLLDPTFRGMLSPEEAALAETLGQLADLRATAAHLPGWRRVDELLREFGG